VRNLVYRFGRRNTEVFEHDHVKGSGRLGHGREHHTVLRHHSADQQGLDAVEMARQIRLLKSIGHLLDDHRRLPGGFKDGRLDPRALAARSKRSLTRHIRTRTGDNLSGWLRRARIARAQELLARGSPIELTAVHCGFPDGQAMRLAFKREHGMSPRQWAAKQRLDYRL